MVTTENIQLTESSKERLLKNIKEVDRFLDRRFPKFTIGLMFLVLLLIIFLISQYEDYGFSIFLKLATIFPLTGITVVHLSYFHKRGTAKAIRKYYDSVLQRNSYKALRVNGQWCGTYREGISQYYLFEFDSKRQLLLRINDFSINKELFPNDSFIVPPYELLDVIGNEIICNGKVINSIEFRKIRDLLPAFISLPRGQTMVSRRI
jgi:hypothetical protein